MIIKRVIMPVLLMCVYSAGYGQSAENLMMETIATSDGIEIMQEYDRLGNDLQDPFVIALTEAIVAANGGIAKEAVDKIDRLVSDFGHMLALESKISFLMAYAAYMVQEGRGSEVTGLIRSYLTEPGLQQYFEAYGRGSFEWLLRLTEAGFPAPEILREDRDYTVECRIERLDHELLDKDKPRYNLIVEGLVNGTCHKFLFDSGADSGLFLSDSLATLFECVFLVDSVVVSGTGREYGKMGYLPELNLGGMVFHNLDVVVVPDELFATTLLNQPVIGRRLMNIVGEFTIDVRRSEIIFPFSLSEPPSTGRNQIVVAGQPMIEAFHNGERLIFHFDTGNAWMNMHRSYLDEHREYITAHGQETSTVSGGFGYMGENTVYILPEFLLVISGKEVVLKSMPVETEQVFAHQGNESGALGMGLVKSVDKITVSLARQFVSVE